MTKMLEQQFQHMVIQLAEQNGWLVYHVANVRGQLRAKSSVGFPDLILLKHKVVAWECKRKGRKASEPQQVWIDAFNAVKVESRVITEDDWDYIVNVLSGGDLGAFARLNIALESLKSELKRIMQ